MQQEFAVRNAKNSINYFKSYQTKQLQNGNYIKLSKNYKDIIDHYQQKQNNYERDSLQTQMGQNGERMDLDLPFVRKEEKKDIVLDFCKDQ